MARLGPLSTESVTDSVYRLLREAILEGTLDLGEQLHPERVAAELGVSRTPVHQALAILGREGLVEVVPRKGTFVARLLMEDVEETLDIRRCLEVLACETAIVKATAKDIQELRLLSKAVKDIISDPSAQNEVDRIRAHIIANFVFHEFLVQLSGNRKLTEIYGHLVKIQQQIAKVRYAGESWKDRVVREVEEHDLIIQALENRDLPALQAHVDQHVRRAKQSLTQDMLNDSSGRVRTRGGRSGRQSMQPRRQV